MRILASVAAVACILAPVFAQSVERGHPGRDVGATNGASEKFRPENTAYIYNSPYSDPQKYVLAVDDTEKAPNMREIIWSQCEPNADWYYCYSDHVINDAKNATRSYGGVVYTLTTTYGPSKVEPSDVQLTSVNGGEPKRLYAFVSYYKPIRDNFRSAMIEQKGFTVDGDWLVAPNQDADKQAVQWAKEHNPGPISPYKAEVNSIHELHPEV